jgi:hypothetical protein
MGLGFDLGHLNRVINISSEKRVGKDGNVGELDN